MYLGQIRQSLLSMKLEIFRTSVTKNTTMVTNMSKIRSSLISWSHSSFNFRLRSQLQTVRSNVTNHTTMVTSRNKFRFSLMLRIRSSHRFLTLNSFTVFLPLFFLAKLAISSLWFLFKGGTYTLTSLRLILVMGLTNQTYLDNLI